MQHGEKRGRALGFPTANLRLDGLHLPRFGVYAVLVDVLTGPHRGRYGGAASIGVRPTFGVNAPNLEVYLLDFDGDLYGAELSVALVAFLRPELRFDGIEPLVAQMRSTSAEARRDAGAGRRRAMIETERLNLRRWQLRDREPFAQLNADPEVMAHFARTLAREESDALVDRLEARLGRGRHRLRGGRAPVRRRLPGHGRPRAGALRAARGRRRGRLAARARALGAGLRHRGGTRLARVRLRHDADSPRSSPSRCPTTPARRR